MPDIYNKGVTIVFKKTPQEKNELNYRQKTNRAYKTTLKLKLWFIVLSIITLTNSILLGYIVCKLAMEN